MHAPVVSGAEDQVHGQGTELAVAGNPTKLLCLQGCKWGSSVSQEGCQVTGTASVMPSPTRVQEGEEKKNCKALLKGNCRGNTCSANATAALETQGNVSLCLDSNRKC